MFEFTHVREDIVDIIFTQKKQTFGLLKTLTCNKRNQLLIHGDSQVKYAQK